jgi:hypothetical protein
MLSHAGSPVPARRFSSFRVARVVDRLQIAGDDFVEQCSFRAGDLDDAVSRHREHHLGDDGGNIARRDGLEQPAGSLTMFPFVLSAAMLPRNSRNWVERMMV